MVALSGKKGRPHHKDRCPRQIWADAAQGAFDSLQLSDEPLTSSPLFVRQSHLLFLNQEKAIYFSPHCNLFRLQNTATADKFPQMQKRLKAQVHSEFIRKSIQKGTKNNVLGVFWGFFLLIILYHSSDLSRIRNPLNCKMPNNSMR
jgi:hypothetical protein